MMMMMMMIMMVMMMMMMMNYHYNIFKLPTTTSPTTDQTAQVLQWSEHRTRLRSNEKLTNARAPTTFAPKSLNRKRAHHIYGTTPKPLNSAEKTQFHSFAPWHTLPYLQLRAHQRNHHPRRWNLHASMAGGPWSCVENVWEKRLCEPVCVRGTSSLQLTSQRPWATRQAVCLNTFVCQLSLPVFRTSESMLNWLHGSCMIYRSCATWCCAYSSQQSTLALLHLGEPCPMQQATPMPREGAPCWLPLGLSFKRQKVQFQPRKKMFQHIGPG